MSPSVPSLYLFLKRVLHPESDEPDRVRLGHLGDQSKVVPSFLVEVRDAALLVVGVEQEEELEEEGQQVQEADRIGLANLEALHSDIAQDGREEG